MKAVKRWFTALVWLGLSSAALAESVTELHIQLQRSDTQAARSETLTPAMNAQLVEAVTKQAKYFEDDDIVSTDQLMILGKNAHGHVVFRQVANNPLLMHAESFDPVSGKIEVAKTIEKDSATLRINIPSQTSMHTLEINSIRQKGSEYQFNLLNQLSLENLKAMQKMQRPSSQLDKASGVFSVIKNGDSANRADLVLLSEGYTASDLAQFESDVQGIVQGYFEEDIYKEYKNHFNVWRVEVASNQRGAGNGAPIDTKFGAHFNCYNIERLLCVDEDKVLNYLRSVMPANAMDKVLVVVNTEKYGGAGGQVATMSLAPQTIDLALHELGHSFAKLADEYDYGNCNIYEPDHANVTSDSSGAKWRHWINLDANIGIYEGAMYCATGMYRPTENSMMRELGQPFYAVNESEIVRRLYGYVDTIDSVQPTQSRINMELGEARDFNVTQVDTQSGSVVTQWYVNEQKTAEGTGFTFDGSQYPQGSYRLKAVTADTTARVIKDPNQLLRSQHSWTIALGDSGSDCDKAPATPDGLTTTEVGDTFFSVGWNAVATANRYRADIWNESTSQWDTLAVTANTTATATGLAAGSSQWLRVAASNACGDSEPSDYITIELNDNKDCTQAPGAPGTPTASNISSGRFTLSWTAANGATSYMVQKWTGWEWQDHLQARSTSVSLSATRTTHYYRVYGINSCGNGQASNWLRVDIP